MKKLSRIALGALIFGALAGCIDPDAAKSELQASGQDIVNEAAEQATQDLIQRKSLDEVKKNVKESAKNTAKQKAESKLKEVDRKTTGGVGSAIYDATKK